MENVDFELRRQDFWTASNSTIFPDDASATVFASATGPSGDETLVLQAPTLTEGRWYVIARTPSGLPVDYRLRVTLEGTQAPTPPGSYYNPQRPGHGLFLYPAGNQWAGLWYAYAAQGLPTWYYAQGPKPGADGIWHAPLYHSVWTGTGNRLTPIGHVTVTPNGPDAFTFTHEVHGLTGSEPMAALGRGCPTYAGLPVDASSHWFDPASAGSGFSVQLWTQYEYYAAFVYDGQGSARFLAAEVVGREPQHDESAVLVLPMHRLEFAELVGEAAVAGGVDHQNRLSAEALAEFDELVRMKAAQLVACARAEECAGGGTRVGEGGGESCRQRNRQDEAAKDLMQHDRVSGWDSR